MPDVKTKGRPFTTGTILARELNRRRLTVGYVSRAMHVSERMVYNYLTLKYPIPLGSLGNLCTALDMDRDQLVDRKRFLLPDGT